MSGDRLRALGGGRLWGLVFVVVAVVYALTATYDLRQSIDTYNTAVQAYQIATTGSPVIDDLSEPRGLAGQHRPGRDGTVTDRHPGSVAAGVVGYTLARPFLPPPQDVTRFIDVPLWPAALTSALLAAGAVTALGVALARMPGVSRELALAAAIVVAFGTGTWSVSANALWTHTVTQFGIGTAMVGLASGRMLGPGLGFGLAILARPHTALLAAGAGLGVGWQQRRLRPVVVIGLLSASGLALAVLYGLWVFGGDPSLTVGRGSVVQRLQYEGARAPELGVVANVALLFVHPVRGLLPMTPFLVPLALVLPEAWRRAPAWVRGLAVGGLLQLLLQGVVNHYSGGSSFFGSRVSLEFLTASLPLWVLAYVVAEDRPRIREWTHVTAGAAIVVHAAGATVLRAG